VSSIFRANPGFESEIIRDSSMVEALLPLAEQAAAAARGLAPVRLGHYKRSIEGVAGQRDDGIYVGRVLATDFKAHWVEKGTGGPLPTKGLHVLRRAAESVVGSVS
jgi:hypothetical protein